MPTSLARRARAAAAMRGITLSQLVSEALTRFLQADDEPRCDAAQDSIRADVAWYEANRAALLNAYAGQYLAIVEGCVVDHDPEFGPLARRVFAAHPDRPVFMPRCEASERVVRLRSPRVARG
ncbi:MAG: hypothetical protein AB1758_34725 [Candidatus Eremiobacterota bacterium]